MKKVIFNVVLCSLLWANNANSQEINLLEDDSIGTNEENTKAVTDASEEENIAEDEDASFFSFITKPLSLMFSADDEVETENGKKETFLEKSIRMANEGSLADQMNLGYMYLYGTNGVEQNFENSFKYYAMAADQNDPIALNNLGSLYFNGIGTKQNHGKALELFSKSADLGNDNAATNLAFILLTGGAKDEVRNRKAVELFQKAADAGNNIAKFMLGYAYLQGFAKEKDFYAAMDLIHESATGKSKFDEAQLVLAQMYLKGYGTVQNYAKVIGAYNSACGQGNMEACMELADIYTKGRITPVNPILAHALYNVCAANGVSKAEEERDKIEKLLNLESLLKAQEIAQNFKANPSELTTYAHQTYGENVRSYIDMNIIQTEKELPDDKK
jgi:hypothetical protein